MDKKVDFLGLTAEKEALDEFFASAGYKAAKAVTDAEIQDGLQLLIDLDLQSDADLWKLLETRAEVRAQQKFHRRFVDRYNEIKELLGNSNQPLDE